MQILRPKNVVWKVIELGIDAMYYCIIVCRVVKSISIFVANKLNCVAVMIILIIIIYLYL